MVRSGHDLSGHRRRPPSSSCRKPAPRRPTSRRWWPKPACSAASFAAASSSTTKPPNSCRTCTASTPRWPTCIARPGIPIGRRRRTPRSARCRPPTARRIPPSASSPAATTCRSSPSPPRPRVARGPLLARKRPTNSPCRRSSAWANCRHRPNCISFAPEIARDQGQHLESVREWREALVLMPGNPRLRRELAESLFMAQDYRAALAEAESMLAGRSEIARAELHRRRQPAAPGRTGEGGALSQGRARRRPETAGRGRLAGPGAVALGQSRRGRPPPGKSARTG